MVARRWAHWIAGILLVSAFSVFSAPTSAQTIDVPEGQLIGLPFWGYSGDVLLQEPGGRIDDVFRIFNDIVDTGGGTGLGDVAFLYGSDAGNLPDPSTYSVNAVTIPLGTSIGNGLLETDYNVYGTSYRLFTAAVPEPGVGPLAAIGFVTLGFLGAMHRRKPSRLT